MRWLRGAFLALVTVFMLPTSASATPGCDNAQVLGPNLLTNVCWSCFFPIRVAGIPLNGSSSGAPSGAYSSPMCFCPGRFGVPTPGFTMSMWEPARLVEFQRVPGCMSALNGVTLPFDRTRQGTHGSTDNSQTERPLFTHYHYYYFPLMAMLDLFTSFACNDGAMDMDLMYVSELDPTWNSSELAFFTNPEASAVANVAAQTACTADAAGAAVGSPIESLFWCAGSWGGLYPLAGHTAGKTVLQATSLYKARVLASLHRRGLAHKTMGSSAVCDSHVSLRMPKTQYKFNTFYFNPETSRSHVMGETTLRWGSNRLAPTITDPIYMIWRWRDCCVNL